MSTLRHPRHRVGFVVAALFAVMAAVAGCEAAPPPGTSHSPSGHIDTVTWFCNTGGCGWVVKGWASDWDTTAPINVMFWVSRPGQPPEEQGWTKILRDPRDGSSYGPLLLADLPRPDVQAAYGHGANSGFSGTVAYYTFPFGLDTRQTVCVAAVNVGPGDHTLLGCVTGSANTLPWGPF